MQGKLRKVNQIKDI